MAIDEWYHHRRKDDEGDFYRKVVYQREGMKPDRTTQGFYIFAPDGKMIEGWNNRDTPKVKRNLDKALKDYKPPQGESLSEKEDPRFARAIPEGGAVVDVFSRITEANWPPAKKEWDKLFRESTGRDHMWITKKEVASLVRGTMPESLSRRLVRYHLVDNTRGEPPMWQSKEILDLTLKHTPEKGRLRLDATIHLATVNDDRGYQAKLLGYVESQNGKITRFDVVVRGQFWGEGTYTKGAPPGKFTLAIAFTLADKSEAIRVPPQGGRDFQEYIQD